MRSIGLLLLCMTMQAGALSMPHGGGTARDIHPKAFIRNEGQWSDKVRYGILGSSAKAARIGPVLVTIRGAREYASMLLLLTP